MAKLPAFSSQFIAMSGGMDLATPPIAKANSDAIIALNVQPLFSGGFTRIEGYESIDGKIIPSEMKYYLIVLQDVPPPTLLNSEFLLDNKPAKVIEVIDNSIVVISQVGAAVFTKSSISIGEFTSVITYITSSVGDVNKSRDYLAKAFQYGCDLVRSVDGEGILRGVAELNENLIVFRDQDLFCGAFISDKDEGWKPVPKTYVIELSVSAHPEYFADGAKFTVDQQMHIALSSNVSTDNKKVTLICHSLFELNKQVSINNEVVGTVTACNEVTLTKGGYFEIIYHNFYGGVDTQYAYACNGYEVIEIRQDGSLIPIKVNAQYPQHIVAHKNHLFVSFKGGQVGHSLVGYPTRWSVLLGSEQFGLGDEITALSSAVGGVLLICCEHKVSALYGSTSDDWALKGLSKVGIQAGTLQSTFVPVGISTNGITRIDQTEQFGDFKLSELDASRKLGFNPLDNKISFTSTLANRNQVRFYSSSGSHLCIMLLPDGTTKSTYFNYPDKLTGVWQSNNYTYLAFNDGKVYRQNENCYSYAGKQIEWLIKMSFNHCGSPTTIKSWHSAELQATTQGEGKLKYRYDLDYNANFHATKLNEDISIYGGGGRWNDSFWNNFLWSAEDYSTPTFQLSGYSRNISLSFSGDELYAPPFELTGLIINYITRRLYRV
ncbi:hypothetical protein QV08_01305 [Gallibacterium salpingitidis]|uniref:Uncharacterized protein n=1 Tax=Gallibacterium salpingitidis TaxID=505341 RepID=A0AB36E2P2_9PAST|nr:hypothetical protein [Gallibacterium salpingitidis]OBX09602.1 hypothetical protein QV08_01305 [Gallibacterium salpingitidis]OBX10457.1 hypothetical protein QV09_05860 [Gallibacterium salpingitidis]